MRSESKTLLTNTALFFVGGIGSKLIQFLLVPLYTYTLTASEFGTADLVLTTMNFLIPFLSVQISDGLLRFGLDKKLKQKDVINCSFRIVAIGSLVSIILIPIFILSDLLRNWLFFFLIIMNLRVYRDLFTIILKIKNKNKYFAIDSILYTLILCISSVLFLVVFKGGISGYFYSYIIANLFSIIFILLVSKIKIGSLFGKTNKKLTRKILIYSAPLVINSLAYWLTSASDRYMIKWLLDEGSVGLYAVAAKIPTILTTIVGIFSQAWLISSINQYEDKKGNNFYSSVFVYFCQLSMIVGSIIILLIKPFMKLYVSSSYYEAWQYAPLLVISAVFSGVCSFLNCIYYAYKKNIAATITTIVGAVANIALNLILISAFGIIGAAIATAISWSIIMFSKIIHIRKIVEIKANYICLAASLAMMIIEIIITYTNNDILRYFINAALTILIIYLNRQIVQKIYRSSKKKLKIRSRRQR